MECPKCHSENPDDTRFCGMCATQLEESGKPLASPTDIHVASKTQLIGGSTFAGRYQIIEELGKGGMGKVYKVWDTEVEEKVALKLLNPRTATDDTTIERFRNELKLARQISHRNICRMYDLGKEGETYYITMEYVPGEDLKSSIRRMGPLSAGKAVSIAKQVCRGLTEAHMLGVVHRDLKPQNIMVDREGNVRIMDFGIARSLKTEGITETGVIIGTPEYMSVEQVEGKQVDQRSDIYSLGVILYEMVTGTVPFGGDTPFSIAIKHTTTEPQDPRELNDQIPEALSRVIFRCMDKDKKLRYQSADDLLADLSNIEKGLPTTAIEKSRGESITSREITVSFSPRRVLIPCVIMSLILVAGLAIWQAFSREPVVTASPVKPSISILSFKNNSEDPTLDYWRFGLVELITTDLRQSRFLRVLSWEKTFGILEKLDFLLKAEYSSADLRKVATKGAVDYTLTGSFSTTGKNLVITVVLQNPHTGIVMSSRRIECRQEKDIFPRIDQLTKRIKSDLGLFPEQISKDIDRQLAEITTGSVEAYKCYVQGRENRFEGGSCPRTLELMEKAVVLDPEFALAHKAMAGAFGELGSISEAWQSLRIASQLKKRLSLREHYLIQGELYSMSEETDDRAIEAYEKLLETYPEDVDANFNLGFVLYTDLEQWNEATKRFEVLAQNGADTPEASVYQSGAHMAMGEYHLAKEVLERCLTNFPDEIWLHERVSSVYLCEGKLNLALQEAKKSLLSAPYSVRPVHMGDIYHCRGDWAESEDQYQEMLRTGGPAGQCDGRLRLAALYLSQGQFEKSIEQAKQASLQAEESEDDQRSVKSHLWLSRLNLAGGRPDESKQEWKIARAAAPEGGLDLLPLLHLGGLVYLETGSVVEAERLADELKKVVQAQHNERLMRYHYHLTGMIELEKGNIHEAISNFQAALTLLPYQHSESDNQARFIYPLAVAYYRSGDLEKAQQQFRRLTSLTTGRLFFGDLYAKSFYWLGRIYQEKGWGQEAERHYARFLRLWEGHDWGMPEFGDAQGKLVRGETGA